MTTLEVIKVDSRYDAVVERNVSITLIEPGRERSNTLKMGDMAEYDSYNLSYYGPIIGITEKRIRIVDRHDYKKYLAGESVRTYSLTLPKFAWRNINFDLAQTQAENAEISRSL